MALPTVYNRLFTKILDSSIWLEPDSTRIVWVTLLASMNEDGYCHFSALENLASRARVSRTKAQRAIKTFEAPDPNSENLAYEGRRIERVPGGYLVLNAKYYREKFSREIEREQTRIRVQRHREKNSKCNDAAVTESLQSVSPASASDSSSESEEKEKKPKSVLDTIAYCREQGLTESDGQWLWDKWEGNGFKNDGKPMNSWRATVRQWKRSGTIFLSHKRGIGSSTFQKPKEAAPIYAKAQPPLPPLTEQEIERNKKLSAKMVNDLKNKMRP